MSEHMIDHLVNKNQILKDFGGALPEDKLAFHDVHISSSGYVELSLGSTILPGAIPRSWKPCDAIKLTFGFNALSVAFYGEPSLGFDVELKVSIEDDNFLVSRMNSDERVMCAAGVSAIHLIIRPFIN